jgi:hypothetical protein
MKKDELAGKVDELKDRAKQAVASMGQGSRAEGAGQPSTRTAAAPLPAGSGKTAAGDSTPARRAEGPAEPVQDGEVEDDGGEDIEIDPEIEEADDE